MTRKIRGWTLRDLSDRAKVSNPFLSQIETGRSDPTAKVLARIATALEVSTDWLVGLSDDPRRA